nr:MAG TPA: hypothetical protein [Caudoviricetes sp.]
MLDTESMKRFGTIHYSVNSRSFRFLLIVKIMLVFYYNITLISTIISDFRILLRSPLTRYSTKCRGWSEKLKALTKIKTFKSL